MRFGELSSISPCHKRVQSRLGPVVASQLRPTVDQRMPPGSEQRPPRQRWGITGSRGSRWSEQSTRKRQDARQHVVEVWPFRDRGSRMGESAGRRASHRRRCSCWIGGSIVACLGWLFALALRDDGFWRAMRDAGGEHEAMCSKTWCCSVRSSWWAQGTGCGLGRKTDGPLRRRGDVLSAAAERPDSDDTGVPTL